MSLVQTGSNIKATYKEPTTNADGSPLTDLASTEVEADWGTGPSIVATVAAVSPSGGNVVEAEFTAPVVEGKVMTITAKVFAVDLLGKKSEPSETRSLTIDLLAPAPPTWA